MLLLHNSCPNGPICFEILIMQLVAFYIVGYIMYFKHTLVYNDLSPNSPQTIISNEFNNETAAYLGYFTDTKSLWKFFTRGWKFNVVHLACWDCFLKCKYWFCLITCFVRRTFTNIYLPNKLVAIAPFYGNNYLPQFNS